VFAVQLAAVEVLFRTCFEWRASLGSEFDRLRRLAIEWSFVRDRVEALHRTDFAPQSMTERERKRAQREVEKWTQKRIERFVGGPLESLPEDLSKCDAKGKFRTIDRVRAKWSYKRDVDLRVLVRSHAWLPDALTNPQEVTRHASFMRSVLDLALSGAREGDEEDHDSAFPHDEERWVLGVVATLATQLDNGSVARSLWQPILALPDIAHDWVGVFFDRIHTHSLTQALPPNSYVELVGSLIEDVAGHKRGWAAHERVWDSLVGVGDYYDLWTPEHVQLVEALVPAFKKWMTIVPANGRRLHRVARWLLRPAGVPLRLHAIQWFAGLLDVDDEYSIDDAEESYDAVARLLNAVWEAHEREVRADAATFNAFRTLLRVLGEKRNALGLELIGRLGGLG
jgi:hypothetical protein